MSSQERPAVCGLCQGGQCASPARGKSSMHVWELYLAIIITQRIPAHAVTVHPVLVYSVSRRKEDTCTFTINSNSNCRDHRSSTLLSVHCCSCCTVARQHCAASTTTILTEEERPTLHVSLDLTLQMTTGRCSVG